jgi:hypothetical protein
MVQPAMSAQNVPDDMNDFDDGFSEYSEWFLPASPIFSLMLTRN